MAKTTDQEEYLSQYLMPAFNR